MKKTYFSLCLAAIVLSTFAVSAQKKQAKTVNTSANTTNKQYTEQQFDAGGIKVILKPAANHVVGMELFITGGVGNYSIDKQGIEALALSVLTDGGSKKYPDDEYHALLERKGIEISGTASRDYSLISMRTLDMNWNTAWDIFQDLVVNPAWNAQSFTQQQQQLISSLQQQQADPETYLNDLAIVRTFKGSRYEKRPNGTPESLQKLTLEDLKKHYANILQKKKLMLVVVGNISADDLKKKISAAFANLPEGKADVFTSAPPKIVTGDYIEPREIATNYIIGVSGAPKQGTREIVAMRMAMAILGEHLFQEVRTKRNLSYAPGASLVNLFDPFSVVSVSTTKPNDAVTVIADEIQRLRTEGISTKDLADQKEVFLTSYYLRQETNQAQARALGSAELTQGWRFAEDFKDIIYSLTQDDINKAIRTNLSSISWYYLGNKEQIDEKIFKRELK